MTKGKRQSEQHLIDSKGQRLLRERLPSHWVLRDYRPDYGIDYALEIFSQGANSGNSTTYETLGEHIFIQLKSALLTKRKKLKIYGRHNIEKAPEKLIKSDLIAEIEVIRFQLETSELVTIERMGVGVPVLLVVADISVSKCYFICLNDYVDKILTPRHENYKLKASHVIHVPVFNEIEEPSGGQLALRWYGKRSKLYAAFQRFAFQQAELVHEWKTPEGPERAKYFASRIAAYDFWEDMEMWKIIEVYGKSIQTYIDTGSPAIYGDSVSAIASALSNVGSASEEKYEEYLSDIEIPELWRKLSTLGRVYEDICREWYLPTGVGYMSTYLELVGE